MWWVFKEKEMIVSDIWISITKLLLQNCLKYICCTYNNFYIKVAITVVTYAIAMTDTWKWFTNFFAENNKDKPRTMASIFLTVLPEKNVILFNNQMCNVLELWIDKKVFSSWSPITMKDTLSSSKAFSRQV